MPPRDSGMSAEEVVGKEGTKKYSWKEVARHNTPNDMWVSIDGRVYDITKWANKHPGGSEMLNLIAGRDATVAFASYHPFTKKHESVLPKYEIGVVCDSEFPVYPKDSGFYKELSEAVNGYFVKSGLDHKDMKPGLIRMACVIPIALALNYVAFGPLQAPFAVRAICAAIFGIGQALPLLHVMHDCSHTAFGHSEKYWMFFGRLFFDYYTGCSMTSWHNQHTIGHHIYTNVFQADPDIPLTAENYSRRIVPLQKHVFWVKYQYFLLPIAYGVLGFLMRIADVLDVFGPSRMNGPVRVNPHSSLSHINHILSKIFFLWWRVYLPMKYSHLELSQFIVLFLIAEVATGYWLGLNFQVSHISDVAEFPLSAEKGDNVGMEWAVAQVVTAVDYSHNNAFTTFCCGALNYQIEHHLFPTVSQYHYPAIAPIVMEKCLKHGIKYNLLKDFPDAFAHHIKHLYDMGKEGKAVEIHIG